MRAVRNIVAAILVTAALTSCAETSCKIQCEDANGDPSNCTVAITVSGNASCTLTMNGQTFQVKQASANGAAGENAGSGGTDLCLGTPSVGTVCADGTVYAGLSPDGNAPLYAMPCDLGMMAQRKGDAWMCTGPRDTYSFNNGSGKAVATGYSSFADGKANTAGLVALKDQAPYVAAQACANQTFGGHNDWYLPAEHELAVMCNGTTASAGPNMPGSCPNAAAIGGFNIGNFWYWSSTDDAPNPYCNSAYGFNSSAAIERFANGEQFCNPKKNKFAVRCVRR